MSQKPNRKKKKNNKRRKRKERQRNDAQLEVIDGGKQKKENKAGIDAQDLSGFTYHEWLDESYTWQKVRIIVPIIGLILLAAGLIVMWLSPSIGWPALIASTAGKAICSIGSLAVCIPMAIAITFRYRYGAHDSVRGKLMTATTFVGCFLFALSSFVSVGFTLLCLQDVAAGEKQQAMAPATYAGHNTFLGTKIKAVSLNADGSLIFCREGTESYDMLPDTLKDGDDLNVTLYGNSKTLIKIAVVTKADESKYEIKSIADADNDNDVNSDTASSDTDNASNETNSVANEN